MPKKARTGKRTGQTTDRSLQRLPCWSRHVTRSPKLRPLPPEGQADGRKYLAVNSTSYSPSDIMGIQHTYDHVETDHQDEDGVNVKVGTEIYEEERPEKREKK